MVLFVWSSSTLKRGRLAGPNVAGPKKRNPRFSVRNYLVQLYTECLSQTEFRNDNCRSEKLRKKILNIDRYKESVVGPVRG